MNIDFVPAKSSDAAAISALRQRIWNTTYRDIYPDAVIDDFDYDWHQQRDLKKISDPSFTIYLIKYGDEDIGYFIFQHAGSVVWLHSLYVLQAYQHGGIGKQAFAILKDYCRKKGISRFACNCSPHNENAMRFYQRMGGVVTKTDTGHENRQEDGVIFEFEINQKIHLQTMDRRLLHEYYKGFVMDADIFMDMSNFREYSYVPERVDAYFDKLQSQIDRVDFLIMKDEKPIGEIALKHIDETTRQCELSIHLQNDSVKNQGYGTQAERLILEYAFQTLGMATVIADSVLKNRRSQHVLEKVGFRETGRDNSFVYYRISQFNWLKLGDE